MKKSLTLLVSMLPLLASCGNGVHDGFSRSYKEAYGKAFNIDDCVLVCFLKRVNDTPYRLTTEAKVSNKDVFSIAMEVAETLAFYVPTDERGKEVADAFKEDQKTGIPYYQFDCYDSKRESEEARWEFMFAPNFVALSFTLSKGSYKSYLFDGKSGNGYDRIEAAVKDEPFEIDSMIIP